MLIEARDIPSGTEIEADICVVGSGPAGLTLGIELESSGARVVILESGGLEPTREAQSLAQAQSLGLPFLEPDISRCRFFGGSSARWAGFCRPLDEDDFLERPWIAGSGWPFRKAELLPFYARAQKIAQVEHAEFYPDDWFLDAHAAAALPKVGDGFFAANIYRSPILYFGTSLRERYRAMANPHLYLGATVTKIETSDDAKSVRRLWVDGFGGNRFSVRARHYVIATGGIENARMLLAANEVQTAGLGNANDLVGRSLMNHPQIISAWIELKTPEAKLQSSEQRSVPASQRVAVTPDIMEREGIAKFSAFMLPSDAMGVHPWVKSRAFAALTSLLGKNQRSALVPDRAALVAEILGDLGGFTTDVVRRITQRFRTSNVICVLAEVEQVPNPDSRVTLTGERDRFGVQRVAVNWRLTEQDKRTLRRGTEVLEERLKRAAVSGTMYHPWVVSDDLETFPGEDWAHHAGTTRMDDDPRKGVVDRNSRVHGMANLYVTGCSVFPTEGMTPPTLTIMALASRLAAHLRAELSSGDTINAGAGAPVAAEG